MEGPHHLRAGNHLHAPVDQEKLSWIGDRFSNVNHNVWIFKELKKMRFYLGWKIIITIKKNKIGRGTIFCNVIIGYVWICQQH